MKGDLFSNIDVAVDIRPKSAAFGRWAGLERTEDDGLALFMPEGFAHGFQTLTPDAVVQYDIAPAYAAAHAAGVRWDDPEIAVAWPPAAERVISERDKALPLLADLSL